MRPLASTRNSFEARAGASFRSSSDGFAGMRGGYSLRPRSRRQHGVRTATVQAMSPLMPSASYSLTIRCRIPQTAGSFARVADAIGEEGGMLGAIDLVRVETRHSVVRDVTVDARRRRARRSRSSRPSAALAGRRGR